MTEKTAVFGRVAFWERIVTVRIVALGAEFFCLLLVHGKELFVNFVVRKFNSGFWRG